MTEDKNKEYTRKLELELAETKGRLKKLESRTVPDAEEMIGQKLSVLDHGFVVPVDYMGSDKRIVDAARVSIAGKKVKAVLKDRHLIRYLLRHKHTSPFEKVRFEFHIKAPIFVMRQWIRHRMSSTNEVSGRYGVLPDEFYIPENQVIQYQSKDNKQGRGKIASASIAKAVKRAIENHSDLAYELYQDMLGNQDEVKSSVFDPAEQIEISHNEGIARELSRVVLPLNIYTEWYWTVDLWNLMHFLRLRLHSHAQYEIQVYGEQLANFVQAVCPISYEAFEDYILYSETFSKKELELLKEVVGAGWHHLGYDRKDDDKLKKVIGSKREVSEFKKKLGL